MCTPLAPSTTTPFRGASDSSLTPLPPPAAGSFRVVVTADDAGYAAVRDQGIFVCARAGLVSAVSLLVSGASAREAARAAAALPHVSLGCHVNLTEGAPSSPPDAVRSLLDPSGTGFMRGKEGFRAALAAGAVSLAHVRAEVRAQLAAFASLTGGAPPAHADGHQHVHVLPGVREVFAEEAAAAGVRWARVPALGAAEAAALPPAREAFYRGVGADCAVARAVFAARGLRSSAAFAGFTLGGAACSVQAVLAACRAAAGAAAGAGARRIDDGAPDLEIMFHPGLRVPAAATAAEAGCGGAAADDFSQSPDREAELAVLSGSALARALASAGVCVVPWGA